MARTFNLNKTSIKKIDSWLKTLDISKNTEFEIEFKNIVKNDVKNIKECAEHHIVDFYIQSANSLLELCNDYPNITTEFYEQLKTNTRSKLADKYTNKTFDNNIDIYFNEVKREYIMHPVNEQDEIEFIPENKEIFIKNNLKLVIECAKRYQNLGLPFEDLIQAGNLGLLRAFEKFNTDRANLRISIINMIKGSANNVFTHNDAEKIIRSGFTYSKNLDKTLVKIPKNGFTSKDDFISWVHTNVKTAVFASVAFQWIRAFILLELNTNGKIIRVPKTSLKREDDDSFDDLEDISDYTDDELSDKKQSITIINLDAINPHTDDCYHDNQIAEVANEEFVIEDEYMENMEKENMFKELVNKLLYKLNAIDRRIIQKRFGINMPYQLSVNEIAESEGISSNKVKYSITNSLKIIANSIPNVDKQTIISLLQ